MGTFYAVSVGPGDPELLTLKALKVLKKTRVIACVKTHRGNTLAKNIVEGMVALDGKEILELEFSMTKDTMKREESYEQHSNRLCQYLKEEDVAMICLGDVGIYSTVDYLSKRIEKMGFESIWIPGVSSFSAAASFLKSSLSAMDEPIHLIPSSFGIEDSLNWTGTKVFMKSATSYSKNRNILLKAYDPSQSLVLENVSLESQEMSLLQDKEKAGYFTLIITKEKT